MTWREPRRPCGASWGSDPRPPAASSLWSWSFGLRAAFTRFCPSPSATWTSEPIASGPRLLELRVYAELDDKSGLEDAAEDWMDGGWPFSEPYSEVARVFGRVFGPQRALSILERGRSDLGRPSLFAIEAGDFLKDLGRMEEAVLEWAGAIGDDGSQVSAVMQRVAEDRGGPRRVRITSYRAVVATAYDRASAPGRGRNRPRGRAIWGGEVPG